MRFREILFEMTYEEAVAVFRNAGYDNPPGMSPQELRAARGVLIKRHHPDTGGDHEKAVAVNLAYELLSKNPPRSVARPAPTKWRIGQTVVAKTTGELGKIQDVHVGGRLPRYLLTWISIDREPKQWLWEDELRDLTVEDVVRVRERNMKRSQTG